MLTSTTSENIEEEKEKKVSSSPTTTKPTNPDNLLHEDIKKCVKFGKKHDITDTVEILRQIEKWIVKGKPLDVVSSCSTIEGDKNYIFVNRQDILSSVFEEFKSITNPHLTLEVSFYGESAEDLGGPRREFFRLSLQEMKAKYFEKGWQMHMAAEYELVGLVLALSTIQNGLVPRFFTEQMLLEVFGSSLPANPCAKMLQKGMDKVG